MSQQKISSHCGSSQLFKKQQTHFCFSQIRSHRADSEKAKLPQRAKLFRKITPGQNQNKMLRIQGAYYASLWELKEMQWEQVHTHTHTNNRITWMETIIFTSTVCARINQQTPLGSRAQEYSSLSKAANGGFGGLKQTEPQLVWVPDGAPGIPTAHKIPLWGCGGWTWVNVWCSHRYVCKASWGGQEHPLFRVWNNAGSPHIGIFSPQGYLVLLSEQPRLLI